MGSMPEEASAMMLRGPGGATVVRGELREGGAGAGREARVVPAHGSQPDLPRLLRRLVDLLDRIAVHVDDVVEEAGAGGDHAGEPLPVEARLVAVRLHELRQVQRAEVAGLVRQQRLLAARVR